MDIDTVLRSFNDASLGHAGCRGTLREGIAVPGVPHLSRPSRKSSPTEPKLCDAFTYCAVFGEAPWLLVASAAQAPLPAVLSRLGAFVLLHGWLPLSGRFVRMSAAAREAPSVLQVAAAPLDYPLRLRSQPRAVRCSRRGL